MAADLADGGRRAAAFTDAVRDHRWIAMLAEDLADSPVTAGVITGR